MKTIIKCEVCHKEIKDDELVFNAWGTTSCQKCFEGKLK